MTDLIWESQYGNCQRAEVETPGGEIHSLMIVPGWEDQTRVDGTTDFSLILTNVSQGREGRCVVRGGGYHFVRRQAESYARSLGIRGYREPIVA